MKYMDKILNLLYTACIQRSATDIFSYIVLGKLMMTQKSPKKRNEAKRVDSTQKRKGGFVNDFRGPPAL